MTNKTYDILKYVAMIALPALAILVSRVCAIWGLSFGAAISETIMAVDLFLGALLKIKSVEYYKTHEVIDSGFDGEADR